VKAESDADLAQYYKAPEGVREKIILDKFVLDSQQVKDEPLSERQTELLVAMLELKAFESDTRRTTAEIAEKVEGRGAQSEKYKQPMAKLAKMRLVDRKEGAGGGCWLTVAGRGRAERIA